jgi:myo-inositol 2-dehydrogenase / D-chiro-inositol 1-dehydrogenase
MCMQIALLGAGRIGQVHANAVAENPRARLVAVHDTDAQAGKALGARHGTAMRTIEEIAQAKDVDAVLICTPTNTHADLIERFARAGKAVFCEKPVDLDATRARACLAVVAAANTPLMVGFNRRFDPHFSALKRAIVEGRIGAVEMITITSRDPAPPPIDYVKASGGIFRDMTIHDFDMARFLLGEEVTSVFATASVLVDPGLGDAGDYDSASVVLSTASGRQCLISNSRRATYGYDQRIEVLGALGMVSAHNQRPEDIEIATHAGFARPPLHDFFMTRYRAAYAREIAAFIEALEQGTDMSPSGEDGLRALLLAEAAQASVQSGRAEVP